MRLMQGESSGGSIAGILGEPMRHADSLLGISPNRGPQRAVQVRIFRGG